MQLIYDIALFFYFAAIRVAAFFNNKKAGEWVEGRRGIFEKMARDFGKRQKGEKLLWMHCASLGEFEQGRTIIEALKAERRELRLLLTFFSPSGYELRKNYEPADRVYYLPRDSAANARRFLDIVQPDLAIFVKYEFWYHYLYCLKEREIPCLLIAANFRPEQPFFKWYGGLHRKMLTCFTQIFVQQEASAALVSSVVEVPVAVAGDTRVDRVAEIARQATPMPLVEMFCGGGEVLVGGSTWPEDEAILFETLRRRDWNSWKIILAPHDIRPAHLQQIEEKWGGSLLRFSECEGMEESALHSARLLLIDNVGMLARLYRFGKLAYVGGGFGAGIHNILEPAAHGLPVVFGPGYRKFEEAVFLLKTGGGFTVENSGELEAIFQKLSDSFFYKKAAGEARAFIDNNQGATAKIMRAIEGLNFWKEPSA